MNSEAKKRSILKLFACYPAMMADEMAVEVMLAAYLETLAAFPDKIISEACQHVRREDWRLPPSAGQIYAVCGELNARRLAAARAALPKPMEQKLEEPRITQERWDDLRRMIADAALESRFPQ